MRSFFESLIHGARDLLTIGAPLDPVSEREMAIRVLALSTELAQNFCRKLGVTDSSFAVEVIIEYSFFCISEIKVAKLPWADDTYCKMVSQLVQTHLKRIAANNGIDPHKSRTFHSTAKIRINQYVPLDSRARLYCLHSYICKATGLESWAFCYLDLFTDSNHDVGPRLFTKPLPKPQESTTYPLLSSSDIEG